MSPGSQSVLVSHSAGQRIPPELLREILEYLNNLHLPSGGTAPKRGLTNCSLVCRYWAKAIRAMLFGHLDFKSHDDLRQLAAFMAAPDILGNSIEDCVCFINITYDAPPLGIPWAHDIPSYGGLPKHRNLFVKWIVQGKPGEEGAFARHRAGRPRSVPPSIMPVHGLVFRDLHDMRVRDFVQYSRCLRARHIELRNVSFVEGADPAAMPRPSLTLCEEFSQREYKVDFVRCVRGAGDLLFWLRLINVVAFGFRMPAVPMESPVEAHLLRKLQLATELNQRQDSIMSLQLRDRRSSHCHLASAWVYDLSVAIGDRERIITSVDVYFWLIVRSSVSEATVYTPAIQCPSNAKRFTDVLGPLFFATSVPEQSIFQNCHHAKHMRAIMRGVVDFRLLPWDAPIFAYFSYSFHFGCGTARRIRAVQTRVGLMHGAAPGTAIGTRRRYHLWENYGVRRLGSV